MHSQTSQPEPSASIQAQYFQAHHWIPEVIAKFEQDTPQIYSAIVNRRVNYLYQLQDTDFSTWWAS